MAPLKMTLDAYYKGDTWKGFTLDSILIDGVVPTVNLASCKLQFRDKTGALGYELNSIEAICKGLITINDATTWALSIGGMVLDLEAGTWWWDLEMVDVNGDILTVLTGRLRVVDDITHY